MPDEQKPHFLLTQPGWRTLAAAAILVSALMAWFGVKWEALRESSVLFFGYWGLFAILLLGAVYIAFLDMRYIRLQYRIAERELFRQTLGEDSFRDELRAAYRKAGEDKKGGKSGKS